MRFKLRLILYMGLLVATFALPAKAGAHAATITYESSVEVQITAADNDGPMAGAEVIVYEPDLITVYDQGTCDAQGKYSFAPDMSKPGDWKVRINHDHSHLMYVTVGENVSASGGIGGFSTLQIVLMSACVIWGIIGTALYFRRKREANAHS